MSPSAPTIHGPSPELVERARAGDPEALEGLIRDIHPQVLRWARVRTRDPGDADDVAQEVLIRVVRKLGSYRSDARFTSWLYRIVANVAVDGLRRRRRTADRDEGLAAAGDVAAPADDPAGAVDRARLLGRVQAEFHALPPRQREIFDLAELQGLDSGEVAELLQISPSTVRVSLLNARRTIRKRIMDSHRELAEETIP